MERCGWNLPDNRKCESLIEVLRNFENGDILLDECARLAQRNTKGSNELALAKLHDYDSLVKIERVCEELGWAALNTCAYHGGFDLETKPKTKQIYRYEQPNTVTNRVSLQPKKKLCEDTLIISKGPIKLSESPDNLHDIKLNDTQPHCQQAA